MSDALVATGTMRAARLTGPGRVEVVEVELPEPGPGRCASAWRGAASAPGPARPGARRHPATAPTVDSCCGTGR